MWSWSRVKRSRWAAQGQGACVRACLIITCLPCVLHSRCRTRACMHARVRVAPRCRCWSTQATDVRGVRGPQTQEALLAGFTHKVPKVAVACMDVLVQAIR